MLTASTVGSLFTNSNDKDYKGDFNYKFAKFFYDKVDKLDGGASKPENSVASIENKVKNFSSAISSNFEGLMSKAQSFFDDKGVQSAEFDNKGRKTNFKY